MRVRPNNLYWAKWSTQRTKKNFFGANWTKNTKNTINLEPSLRFSQARPHFSWNH